MSAGAALTARGCGISSLHWILVKQALRSCESDFTDRDAVTVLDVCNNEILTMEGLGEYTALQSLLVAHNKLASLAQAQSLGLRQLNVSGNRLSTLEGIETLPQLEWLDASLNALEAVADLSACTGLQYLRLSCNPIYNLAGIEDLLELETLLLDENTVQSTLQLRPLSILPKLQMLALAGNPLAKKISHQRLKGELRNLLPGLRVLDGEEVGARQSYSSARVRRWLELQAPAIPGLGISQEGVPAKSPKAGGPHNQRIIAITMLPPAEVKLAGSGAHAGREASNSPRTEPTLMRKPKPQNPQQSCALDHSPSEGWFIDKDGAAIITTGAFHKLRRIESGSSVDRARRQSRVSMNYDVDGDALSDGLGMIEEGHIRKKGESERSGDRAGQRQSRSRSPGHVAERNGVADGPSVGSPPVSSTERSSRRHSHSRSSSQGYDTSGGIIKEGAFRSLRKIESGSSVDRTYKSSRLSHSSHWSSSDDESDAPPVVGFRNLRRIESGSSVEGRLSSVLPEEAKRVHAFIAAGTGSFGSSRGDSSGAESRSHRRSVTFSRKTEEIPSNDSDGAPNRRRSSVTFQDLPTMIPSGNILSPAHTPHRPSVGFNPIAEVIEVAFEDSEPHITAGEHQGDEIPRLRTSVTFLPDPEIIPELLQEGDSASGNGQTILMGEPVLVLPNARGPLTVRVAPRVPSLLSADQGERSGSSLGHSDGSGDSVYEHVPASYRPATPYAPSLSQTLQPSASLGIRTPRALDVPELSAQNASEGAEVKHYGDTPGSFLAELQKTLSGATLLTAQEAGSTLLAAGSMDPMKGQQLAPEGSLLETLPQILAAGTYTFSLEREIAAQLSNSSSTLSDEPGVMTLHESTQRLVAGELFRASIPPHTGSSDTAFKQDPGQQAVAQSANSQKQTGKQAASQLVAQQPLEGDFPGSKGSGSARGDKQVAAKEDHSSMPAGGMTLDSGRLSLRAAELLPQGVATPDTAWALDSGKLSVSQKDGSDTDGPFGAADQQPGRSSASVSSPSDTMRRKYERIANAVLEVDSEASLSSTMSGMPENPIRKDDDDLGDGQEPSSPRRIVHTDTGGSFASPLSSAPCSRSTSANLVDVLGANLQGLGGEISQLVPQATSGTLEDFKNDSDLLLRNPSRLPPTIVEEEETEENLAQEDDAIQHVSHLPKVLASAVVEATAALVEDDRLGKDTSSKLAPSEELEAKAEAAKPSSITSQKYTIPGGRPYYLPSAGGKGWYREKKG